MLVAQPLRVIKRNRVFFVFFVRAAGGNGKTRHRGTGGKLGRGGTGSVQSTRTVVVLHYCLVHEEKSTHKPIECAHCYHDTNRRSFNLHKSPRVRSACFNAGSADTPYQNPTSGKPGCTKAAKKIKGRHGRHNLYGVVPIPFSRAYSYMYDIIIILIVATTLLLIVRTWLE